MDTGNKERMSGDKGRGSGEKARVSHEKTRISGEKERFSGDRVRVTGDKEKWNEVGRGSKEKNNQGAEEVLADDEEKRTETFSELNHASSGEGRRKGSDEKATGSRTSHNEGSKKGSGESARNRERINETVESRKKGVDDMEKVVEVEEVAPEREKEGRIDRDSDSGDEGLSFGLRTKKVRETRLIVNYRYL